MNRLVCLVLGSLCFSSINGNNEVLEEIQGLENGQKEIKSLLLDVLQELKNTNRTAPRPVPALKWYTGGSSLLSVRKITSGDNIRVEVELSVSPDEEVFWLLGYNIIEVDDSEFGTSTTRRHNSTLYTITIPLSSESLYLTCSTPENVVIRYEIDIEAGDEFQTFPNLSNCQVSINDINSTSIGAYFRCTPDLDLRDYWFQKLGFYIKTNGDELEYINLPGYPNPFVNVTFERNSTADATLVYSKEFAEKTKSFVLLLNILIIKTNHIVKSITYVYLKDISQEKNDEDYGFFYYFPNPEPLEGEPLTIYCEAIGRMPPPLTMERNGRKILKGPGISIRNSRTSEVSTSFVTFLHATKDVEGNYSCVGEGEVRKVIPLYQVELKPKIYDSAQQILNVSEATSLRLVVEGSKGVFLTCSSPDQEDIPVDIVERTALSKLNERLEVEVSRPIKKPEPFEIQQVVCVARDKNGENTSEYYF